jgi:hypothetical protein
MPKPDHFIAIQMSFDCHLSFYARRGAENGPAHWQKTEMGLGGKEMSTKTFWVARKDPEFYHTLLIPVDRRAIDALRDFIDMTVMYGGDIRHSHDDQGGAVTETTSEVPFYFSMDMSVDPRFERKGIVPSLLGGPETRYFPDSLEMKAYRGNLPPRHGLLRKIWNELTWQAGSVVDSYTRGFQKDPSSLPRARANCWTFAQGMTEYYARADLAAIDPHLSTSYRALHAQSWLMAQLGKYEAKDITRHPWKEYTLPESASRLVTIQNDPMLQPVMLIDHADSFLNLLEGGWIDGQTGEKIAPLEDLFHADLALFGAAPPGEDPPLRPLPKNPAP